MCIPVTSTTIYDSIHDEYYSFIKYFRPFYPLPSFEQNMKRRLLTIGKNNFII